MVRYGFVINLSTCIGCGACVAACTEENSLVIKEVNEKATVPLGSRRDIKVIETGQFPSVARIVYHHMCMHCEEAPCMKVCPTGATYMTKEGVVLIDYNVCIGCKYCMTACPYNARYLNKVIGGPDKCTMCYHRIKKGLEPACVASCPTDSLVFGDLDNPNSVISRLLKKAVPVGAALGTKPKVYIIPP